MQTFLPYPDFEKSASVLDDVRLGNQRNECFVLLDVIFKSTTMKAQPKQTEPVHGIWMFGMPKSNPNELPWYNHTATRMWRDYRWALLCYAYTILREWERRGKGDNTRWKLAKFGYELTQAQLQSWENRINERFRYNRNEYERAELLPWWLGNTLLHASHRSALLEKDFDYYSQFRWEETPGMRVYWPC